jgi:hypothetical protein
MASEEVRIPRLSATARPLAISRCHEAGATALVPDNKACFARVADSGTGLSDCPEPSRGRQKHPEPKAS